MTNFLENKILDHVLGVAAYPRPSTIFLSLHHNTDGLTASYLEQGLYTNEIPLYLGPGGTLSTAYSRFPIGFGSPTFTYLGRASGGIIGQWQDFNLPIATNDWGTVTHFALSDLTTSVILFWGVLNTPVTINTGDRFLFRDQQCKVQLS
jgi:hypothetical protein